MSYTQLVNPDLSVSGSIGWCLAYAARVFHCQGVAPNAWTAWQRTQHQHTDELPSDVAVPCWFSFFTSINGIYANYGHVVISVPGQGFYSSPWKAGTDHAVLPSIAEVERIYGVHYVGWSEDILNVQVIEGEDMSVYDAVPTEDDIRAHYQKRLFRDPTPAELANVLKHGWGAILDDNVTELGSRLKAAEQAMTGDGQVLQAGKYIVK